MTHIKAVATISCVNQTGNFTCTRGATTLTITVVIPDIGVVSKDTKWSVAVILLLLKKSKQKKSKKTKKQKTKIRFLSQ